MNLRPIFLTTLLCGFLISINHAHAKQPHEDPPQNSLYSQAAQINIESNLLIKRFRHLGLPHSKFAAPSELEIKQIEDKFIQWKISIESEIKQINENDKTSIAKHVLLIKYFLENLKNIAFLRASLNLPLDESWAQTQALIVPKELLRKIQSIDQIEKSRAGNPAATWQLNPHLKLSASYLQGLEVGTLANQPNHPNYFKAIQFVMTQQLLNLIRRTENLTSNLKAPLKSISIPTKLAKELRTFLSIDQIEKEGIQAQESSRFHFGLIRSVPSVLSQIQNFVTDEWISGLAEILFSEPDLRTAAISDLFKKFIEWEEKKTIETVLESLNEIHLNTYLFSPDEINSKLRDLVAKSKSKIQIQTILDLQENEEIEMDAEQYQRAVAWILSREKEYKDSIPVSVIEKWIEASKNDYVRNLIEEKETFIQRLATISALIFNIEKGIYPDTPVDLSLLALLFQENIRKLALRPEIDQALIEILSTEINFASAKAEYFEFYKSLPDPDKLPPLVLRDRLAEGRKKDIRDWMHVGDTLGFLRRDLKETPTVKELLSDPEEVKKYFELFKSQLLGLYPMLELKVKVRDIRKLFGSARIPLYQAIAQAWILSEYTGENPAPKVDSLLLSWIDDALSQVKLQTLENINTVGNAHKLEDLEPVITGSALNSILLSEFAEFNQFHNKFFEEKLLPSETDRFMHHYVESSIFYTCTPIFVVLLSKWGGGGLRWILRHGARHILPLKALLGSQAVLRFIQSRSKIALERSLPRSAFYRGLMKAVLVPIVVDTGYQFYKWNELYSNREQMHNFYYYAPTHQDSFFNPGEIEFEEQAYYWGTGGLAFRLVIDSYFMWYPMIAGPLIKKFGKPLTLLDFQQDLIAFARLRLEPGDWEGIEAAFKKMPHRLKDRSITPDEFKKSEKAFHRLSEKKQSGLTWDPWSIRFRGSSTETEKALSKIILPARRTSHEK